MLALQSSPKEFYAARMFITVQALFELARSAWTPHQESMLSGRHGGWNGGQHGPLPEAGGRPPSQMCCMTAHIWRSAITVPRVLFGFVYSSGVLISDVASRALFQSSSRSTKVFKNSPPLSASLLILPYYPIISWRYKQADFLGPTNRSYQFSDG